MRSRRSFVRLGLLGAATLAASSASALPVYHGSARGGGIVTVRDDAGRNCTGAARAGGGRASTYYVTDNTRFVVGAAPGGWRDVTVGAAVNVRWHRVGGKHVADIVAVRKRPGN